ncbi:phosphodiesterase [Rhodococcus zopfii]|uniref:Phosphodiesterase n=1 Tax=Rhodococcus zopfii TaxID=43772 RepID=A0ABU3WVQ8_9NOCA|nr:phosphodiesterase [Rhodococcus zopfii]
MTETFRIAEYPRPTHTLVQISDTHFTADSVPLHGVVDCEQKLTEVLAAVAGTGTPVDALLLTGDLTDAGDPGAYRRLREVVEPAAAALGVPVLWTMGNHDERAAFRVNLLDAAPTAEPVDAVHDVNGLRVICLDSSIPGESRGEVTAGQAQWLADELSTPAEHGTILSIHHPPLPVTVERAVLWELCDQWRLADAVRGTDVRSIVSGHVHYTSSGMFAGIPVSTATAVAYSADLSAPADAHRGADGGGGYTLIAVYDDTIVHTAVPLLAPCATVGSMHTRDDIAAELDREGVHIREQVPARDGRMHRSLPHRST